MQGDKILEGKRRRDSTSHHLVAGTKMYLLVLAEVQSNSGGLQRMGAGGQNVGAGGIHNRGRDQLQSG